MNIIKKLLIKNLINSLLYQLGDISVKIAESSLTKCCFSGGLYETKFPEELLETEK